MSSPLYSSLSPRNAKMRWLGTLEMDDKFLDPRRDEIDLMRIIVESVESKEMTVQEMS